jgi:serine/threonine-protein kinase
VAVPEVIGDTEQVATAKFTAVGIRVNAVRRVTNAQPPGRVVSTDPGPGAMVPVGSTVDIVVAQAPPTTAPPTLPPSSPSN